MRTTIDLPDKLLKQAKIKAVQEGITLKQLFVRCLEKELDGGVSMEAEPEVPKKPSFRSALSGGSKLNIDATSSGFDGMKDFK